MMNFNKTCQMAGNLEYCKAYAFECTVSLLQHKYARNKELKLTGIVHDDSVYQNNKSHVQNLL